MAKVPAKRVLKALSDSHLRAIGMVAAQWAELELSLLYVLSQVCGLTLTNTVILAGSQNATAWCEMLRKLTGPNQLPGRPKVKTNLDPVCKEIADLLKLRNDIVHTSWSEPERVGGLINYVAEQKMRPRASQKAEGIGIPKRGNKIFSFTTFSTSEMLAIANRIQAVELVLYGWLNQRKKTNRLAELMLARPSHPTPLKNLGFGVQ